MCPLLRTSARLPEQYREVNQMGDILSMIRQPLSPLAGTLRNRSGATAVAVAFALTAVLGVAGLGTEAASWYYTKRNMQGAADAGAATAAANAAKVLYQGGTPTPSQFTTDAQSIAAKYGFVNGSSSTTVSAVHYQPDSGPCSVATVYCVQVAISQPQPALISGLFLSSGPTIAATAAAKANTQAADTGTVANAPEADGVYVFCKVVSITSAGNTWALPAGIYIFACGGSFPMSGGTLQATGGVTLVFERACPNGAAGTNPGIVSIGGNAT